MDLLNMEWISRSGHDFCSPSALPLRAACPGSARQQRITEETDLIVNEISEAAARGILLHSLTENTLKNTLDVETFLTLPEEDKQQIKWCVARTKEIIDRFKGQKIVVIYEEQVDLSELGISGGRHGSRIDCLILVPGYGAVIIDWKFGRGWVTIPEYNLQTKTYAWGVHHNYGGNVETIILQPQSPEGREYMFHTIIEDQFEGIEKRVKEIVSNAKSPNAPLVRGEHCESLFCPLRGSICPLWNRSLLEIPDKQSIATYFEILPPSDRKKLFDQIKTISHVAKHCEEVIKKMCIDGGLEMDGYEVKDSRPSYHCNDVEAIVKKLLPIAKEQGLTAEDLFLPAIPEQAKNKSDYLKLLGNKKEIRDILDTLFVKVTGKKTLKRIKE